MIYICFPWYCSSSFPRDHKFTFKWHVHKSTPTHSGEMKYTVKITFKFLNVIFRLLSVSRAVCLDIENDQWHFFDLSTQNNWRDISTSPQHTLLQDGKMQHTNTHVQSHLIYFRYGILPASHSGEEIGLPRTRKNTLQEIRLQQKQNRTQTRKESTTSTNEYTTKK